VHQGVFQFLTPIRRRWWLIAIIVVPICLITAGISIFSPTIYDGFVTVTEKRVDEKSKVDIYPTLAPSMVDVETRMNNLIRTIASPTVLHKTYTDLVTAGEWRPKSSDFIKGFEEFQSKVEIEPLKGSEHIRIHFQVEDKDAALIGIRRLYSNFRDLYIDLNSRAVKSDKDFIASQLKDVRAEYEDIADRLKVYKEENDAVGVSATTSNWVGLRADLLSKLNEADRDIARYKRSLAIFEGVMGEASLTPVIATSVTTVLNPVYNQLRQRLAEVTTQRAGLEQTYGINHPSMKALIEEQNKLESELKALEDRDEVYLKSATGQTRNPRITEGERNIDAIRASLVATQKARDELTKQLEEQTAKLRDIPAKEKQLALLQTEFEARAKDILLLEARLTEAQIKEQGSQSLGITMIDRPFNPQMPKKTWIKVALAFGLSFSLSVGLVLVLGQFDAGTYSPMQAENALGFPVIASLPRTKQAELPKTDEVPSPLAASYQMLSTNILEMRGRLQGPAIVVAAAEPNAGRSSVAANLAVSLARDGARVVLVDGDLREPSLHHHFEVENRAGLVDILSGTANIEDVAMPTPVDGLLIITAGKPPSNPVRLLRSERLEWFLEQVAQATDFVILDSPSGSAFADPDIVAGTVQNVILVHEAGSPATASEMEFHKRLERLGVNIVGVALNKVRPEDCHGYTNYRRAYEASILGRAEVTPVPTRPAISARRERPRRGPTPVQTIDEEEDEE
jgi:succinoglycan biosynthesis transport protein ExoP